MLRSIFNKNYRQLALMGAFRTGTNYVRYLLEKNFECKVSFDAYGWKHSGVPIFSRHSKFSYPKMPVVYVYKHPAAFVVSLYNYFLQVNKNIMASTEWEEFLRKPFVIYDLKSEGSPQMRFSNPVQYWNFIYWNLSNLPVDRINSEGLRYESVLENPEFEVGSVASRLGLRRNSLPFSVPEGRLRRLNDRSFNPQKAVRDEKFDDDLYKNRKFFSLYTEADLQFLRKEVDGQLMAQFSYDLN